MSSTTYSDWHTLTVEPDGEDDGKPVMGYTLTHPDSCPPPDPTDQFPAYDCWLADQVGEFSDYPDTIGLPTQPGVYRVRGWATPGDWAGDHYIEPDGGIEVDEQSP
ncbi:MULTISPECIES: hypothetical protein [Nocardia]|uniref:hypothetical protein n=1 Tax=Nocardia TaxID=1817 RepID=UPI002456F960|nr:MULTISPECIES: hypothetical protein [Nocardia]